jgi:nucleoside-diphosphate-sugar epimerase
MVQPVVEGVKALVTGAAGFLGRHVAAACQRARHAGGRLDDLSAGSARTSRTACDS